MGRLLIAWGVGLNILVIMLFVLTLNGVTTAEIITGLMLKPFVCETDETIWIRDNRAICTNEQYVDRDVTDASIPYLFGGTIGAIVLGIFLISMGNNMSNNQIKQKNDFDYPVNQIRSQDLEAYQHLQEVDFEAIKANIPPEAKVLIQQVFSQMGQAFDLDTETGTLAERLQELEDARQKGLITQVESDRVRQAILDSMDD